MDIRGEGDIYIGDESEQLSYSVIKDAEEITFNTNLNIKNNPLTINFLDYKKKKGNSSEILLKGIYKKNKELILKDISITEKNNQILIKDLLLSKNFKIKDLDYIKLNYRNINDLLNNVELKKNKCFLWRTTNQLAKGYYGKHPMVETYFKIDDYIYQGFGRMVWEAEDIRIIKSAFII